jgi:para-aminobenzoate synthetase component 1
VITHWTGEKALVFTDRSDSGLNFDFPAGSCINGRFQKKERTTSDLSAVPSLPSTDPIIRKRPISLKKYNRKFAKVIKRQLEGDNYLLNLCVRTPITIADSSMNIYSRGSALYKYRVKNAMLCFSPESFIQIQGNTIQTCPMKGTIKNERNTSLQELLDDRKEKAEHTAVTDLLRNDLNMVAAGVHVVKYRFPSYVKNRNCELIQTSTLIRGTLQENWREHFGLLLWKLLPAGSVTGVPKIMAKRLISEIEKEDRGYYTGIAGFFDGEIFDSCVSIRFITKDFLGWNYFSGGGIMVDSVAEKEYRELLDKIYVPV